MNKKYDLIVIGAGSGGVRAARTAASLGAKVAIIEKSELGGTCVNLGCIPKKLFAYSAHFSEEFKTAAGYGWTVSSPRFEWSTLLHNKNAEIKRLNRVYDKLLSESGVTIFRGTATFNDEQSVRVNNALLSAKYIVIAVGGHPHTPNIPGNEYLHTSNDVFHFKYLPKRIAVIGSGYIAMEFSGIFRGLGCETHVLHRGESILRGFDHDVQSFLLQEMKKKGIEFFANTNVTEIQTCGDTLVAHLDNETKNEYDAIICACGREPLTKNLGLENAKVQTDEKGSIIVNDNFQTHNPNIYAIGDVINRIQLTPVALAEGMAVARQLFGNAQAAVDYSLIPTAVFSQPNIATVGYSEHEAIQHYSSLAVYSSEFKTLKHTLGGSEERTFIKIIVDKNSDRVVGIHMVGADAAETIQGLAVAMKAGLTKSVLDSTIGIHPSVAEEFVTLREPSYVISN